jgi:ABC-type dipeptide/oligopeptide/nickel transport system permease component
MTVAALQASAAAAPSARAPLMLVLRRLGTALPSVAGVIVVTFLLTRALPGDPAVYFAGIAATQQAVEEIRHQMGLDRSLPLQFLDYLGQLARGDLGTSLITGQPVLTELLTRFPASAELGLSALFLSVAIAVPLGVVAATRPGSLIDHLCRIVTTAGVSLPTFFTGLLLVYFFYYLAGWAPAPLGRLDAFSTTPPRWSGFYLIDSLAAHDLDAFRAALAQLILPAVTLAIFSLAPLARITRAAMLAALGSEFVRMARASGLPALRIVFVYAFRNALLPVITTLGIVCSFLIGGSVLVEKVFAWPGIGSYAVEALIASDYASVQGFVLMMALLYVLLNLCIDIVYGLVDPRVRLEA